MLFQQSLHPDLYYDIISLTRVDQEGRVRREVVKTQEEIPAVIREYFEVKEYAEATGKKLPGSQLVTLTKKDDEKAMITLFIIERAWTLPPEERQKSLDLVALIKKLQKTSITEMSHIAAEQYNIDRTTLESMLSKLEEKGKIKRLDENFVAII